MELFRPTYKDRRGRRRKTANWYLDFADHTGTRRRLPAFTDKHASRELGGKIEELMAYRAGGVVPSAGLTRWIESLPGKLRDKLVKFGLVDPRLAAASKALAEHVDDFHKAILARGRTKDHADLTLARVRRVVEGCGCEFWSDISASRVMTFLAELREGREGISAATSNHYLRAMKSFCKWMVRDRRASESPVDHLAMLNTRVDRRRVRRALTLDELHRLLAATDAAPRRFGMAGPERALLYRLALETGLRANELRTLARASFDLDADPPTVTVAAGYSKHRREDKLPLRPAMVEALRTHLALKLPTALAFAVPEKTAKMLRADLDAANVPYVDCSGRRADFHALRHTFVTNLARSGVHPKVAQSLARHSTIALTMDIYTHVGMDREVEALDRLPDLSTPTPGAARGAASG